MCRPTDVTVGSYKLGHFHLFAFTLFRPRTRDWRSFGAFSAGMVIRFAETCSFPLATFLLSGRLQSKYPSVD
jgi:methanethiol S-methyltransferase